MPKFVKAKINGKVLYLWEKDVRLKCKTTRILSKPLKLEFKFKVEILKPDESAEEGEVLVRFHDKKVDGSRFRYYYEDKIVYLAPRKGFTSQVLHETGHSLGLGEQYEVVKRGRGKRKKTRKRKRYNYTSSGTIEYNTKDSSVMKYGGFNFPSITDYFEIINDTTLISNEEISPYGN